MRPRRSTRKPEPRRSSGPSSPVVTFTTAGALRATTACTLPVRAGAAARVSATAAAAGRGEGSRWTTVESPPRLPVSATTRSATPAPTTAGTSDAVSQRGRDRFRGDGEGGGAKGFDPRGPYGGTPAA